MFQSLKLMFTQDKHSAILEKNRETITRLKFISTFQPGEKINTGLMHIESNSILTSIKRTLNGESRNTTLQFISNTIERSFEIIQTLSFSDQFSEKLICTNIISDMIKAVYGLKNIQKTYKDDKIFVCTIDTIIDTIEAKCMEIKLKKPDLFPIIKSDLKDENLNSESNKIEDKIEEKNEDKKNDTQNDKKNNKK